MPEPVNVEEFEAIAREMLPPGVYDYYAGGAGDETTLRANREAFGRRSIAYRVLVDVRERDLSCRLLGHTLPFPIILAPTALHRMAHPEGEAATARGAAASGALQTLSSISSATLEDVAAAAPGAPRWFQLYCYPDRSVSEMLVKRAHAAGYSAIVLTVDVPYLGNRERDVRNSFTIPEDAAPGNLASIAGVPADGTATVADVLLNDPGLTWDDIPWLRSLSPLPLLVKGIVRADDAARAVAMGVDGMWVSNHGGRQLDGSVATLDVLPRIAEAVGKRIPVIVDGGVRRGTDVLKAIALGADAVAIGRPQLWGLAAGGAGGVRAVVELLRDDFSLAMALSGCRSPADIDESLIA